MKNKSILLVDDYNPNIRYLETVLNLHRYNVDTASNGEEALNRIKNKS